MSLRSSPRRPRSQAMAGASARRGSPWAVWRTNLGASPRPKPRYVGHCWPTSTRSGRQSPRPSPTPARSPTMPSKSSWPSALHCAHCRQREHAHECHRTTDVTLRRAAHAATLIRIEYEAQRPVVFGPQTAKDAVDPPQFLWPVASSVGDAEKAIAAAAVSIERTYTTSDRHHNQMEPHATTAVWDADGTLTLYETTQHIFGAKELVSIVLGIPPEKINVVSHFLGGGFGGKAYVWPHTLLAALAAKVLKRPVRLQLTRAQMYAMVGHQPATIQTIALGAGKDGKLTGIRHDSISPTPIFDSYIEYAGLVSRSLWAVSGGITTKHKFVHVHRNTQTALRSQHETLDNSALVR